MLAQITATKLEKSLRATGKVSSSGTALLINASRASHLRVRATTKSKFNYPINYYDRRGSAAYIECNSTVASLVTAADASFNSNQLPLNYYPSGDSTKTAVATYIPVESFALGFRGNTAPNRS